MRDVKRIHFHHADGSALGGHIRSPFEELIPVQAPASLPPVGGHTDVQAGEFEYKGLISFKSAHTQVSGTASHENGPWTTLVTSAIEGLNIADVITADRVVARISTTHPAEGYHPKVSFTGTQYENLRVNGCAITPVLDLEILKQGDGRSYPSQAHFHNQEFLDKISQRQNLLAQEKQRNESLGHKISDLVSRHVNSYSEATIKESGFLLCSLVKEIKGECAGTRLGHVIDVPDFGRVFLAELVVDQGSYQLIMIRVELGCPVVGDAATVTAKINGRTFP